MPDYQEVRTIDNPEEAEDTGSVTITIAHRFFLLRRRQQHPYADDTISFRDGDRCRWEALPTYEWTNSGVGELCILDLDLRRVGIALPVPLGE